MSAPTPREVVEKFFHQVIRGDFTADNPDDLALALAARASVVALTAAQPAPSISGIALPKASSISVVNSDAGSVELRDNYTADQMRAYAKLAQPVQPSPAFDVEAAIERISDKMANEGAEACIDTIRAELLAAAGSKQ